MKKTVHLTVLLGIAFLLSNCFGYSSKSKTVRYRSYKNVKKLAFPAKNWNDLIIYDTLDPSDKYSKIAKITVTGSQSSSEIQLLNKLKKEASKFSVDAILLTEIKEINRHTFNGISASINIISAFSDSGDYIELEMSGEYYTLQMTGIAINFIDE